MKQSKVTLNQSYVVLVSMISALGGLLFGFVITTKKYWVNFKGFNVY
jgi:hypothetical protein